MAETVFQEKLTLKAKENEELLRVAKMETENLLTEQTNINKNTTISKDLQDSYKLLQISNKLRLPMKSSFPNILKQLQSISSTQELIKNFQGCENYLSILSEGVPSKKLLEELYTKSTKKKLALNLIKNEICGIYPGYGKRIMAWLIYFTKRAIGDKQKAQEIFGTLNSIDEMLKCGNIHSAYFLVKTANVNFFMYNYY